LLAQKQFIDKKYEGAYNFGPDPSYYVSNGDLVDTFCQMWGPGASWSAVDYNGPHEANILKLDSSKAKSILGWTSQWDIKTSIEKIVSWTKRYLDGEDCATITDRQINDYLENGNV
jgi:CDP-glucose 4,6-dehydratase